MGLIIHEELVNETTGKELESLCPFGALTYKDGKIDISAGCKLCKICVNRGPKGVITFEEEKKVLINKDEYKILDDFLYEAIFIPRGAKKPPREIINNEELQVYIKDFGTDKNDNCLVAEYDSKIVGACWTRIMNDYGHIDNDTPSFAISLYEEYRGKGIGTDLMKTMLKLLKDKGYKRTSLSVQKNNYAVKMYKNVGFKIIDESEEEYIMVCDL